MISEDTAVALYQAMQEQLLARADRLQLQRIAIAVLHWRDQYTARLLVEKYSHMMLASDLGRLRELVAVVDAEKV